MYENTLYDKLIKHSVQGEYPFHMPGHKRNREFTPGVNPYQIDITEIDDFDDLHHPTGCIKDAQIKAAGLYGADETHFLINGCTGGILAAVSACCPCGGTILMGRNAHKSAYNAVLVNNLTPVYIWPKLNGYIFGAVTPEEVEAALRDNNDISCVFITSPTYEGVVSDIKAIAEIAHRYGRPLIVDEAHGAHMIFSDIFPESALSLGADIVINGIHKTLPSLTQTALLHVQGNIVDRECLKKYLEVYQSSSPSYVLMGAIDYSMTYLCHEAVAQYSVYKERLIDLYERLKGLKYIYILPFGYGRDASKIVVCTEWAAVTGYECYEILRKRHRLQPEMSSLYHVVLMTSAWDLKDAYEILVTALYDIDSECERRVFEMGGPYAPAVLDSYPKNKYVYSPGEAELLRRKCREAVVKTDILHSAGCISAEMVYMYPPGIPILVPGEEISSETAAVMEEIQTAGYMLRGVTENKIMVLNNAK